LDDTTLKSLPSIFKAFVLVGGVTTAGLFGGAHLSRTAMAAGADRYQDLDTLAQAMHHIEAQYLGDTTTRELVYGAIRGMMDVLDAHSVFLNPSEMTAAQVRTEGVYSGVGVELKRLQNAITVVRVVPASPADGQVEQGDILNTVDGTPTDSLSDAAQLLQGPDESAVALGLVRKGTPLNLTLTRKRLRDRTVRVSDLGKGWALAELTRFQRNTASDFNRGLLRVAPSIGVIIDLRGNAGGLLDEAVSVVDLFVNEGTIVETRGPDDTTLESHTATKKTPHGSLAIIILVDGDSASASEIVAGALRSLAQARLVGTPTYGKWSVQRMYVFEDQSALKLTVARYHLADTRSGIDLVGLQPNLLVDRPTKADEAIEQLRLLTANTPEAGPFLDLLDKKDAGKVAHPHLGPLTERLTLDPQLAAAWTLALNNP
jgi:carboxyl-terminal processing protease